jgi:hypothetical protein
VITVRDAREIPHAAFMRVSGWGQEWLQQFMEPLVELMAARTVQEVVAYFKTMPDGIRAQLQAQDPETYAQIEKEVNKLEAENAHD